MKLTNDPLEDSCTRILRCELSSHKFLILIRSFINLSDLSNIKCREISEVEFEYNRIGITEIILLHLI